MPLASASPVRLRVSSPGAAPAIRFPRSVPPARPPERSPGLTAESTRIRSSRSEGGLSLRDPDQPTALAWRSINAIRALAMDAVEAAQSGHPGTPMALAPAAYVLWTRFLRHNPAQSRLAGPRPLRALRRPRLDAAVLAAPPQRATICRSRSCGPSGSGARSRRAIRSAGTRPGSRPRPVRWARASATPWAWRSPSALLGRALQPPGPPDHGSSDLGDRRATAI